MPHPIIRSVGLAIVCAAFAAAGCGDDRSVDANDTKKQTQVTVPADYPLDYCVVSKQKLDSMGGPVEGKIQGRTVFFCCPKCIETAKKDPAKYLKVLDDAKAAKQKKPAG